MQRTLLIHNDGAGDGKISAEALQKILAAAGMKVRHCSPKDPTLDSCLAGAEDLVIVAGGDGTVARMLARMPDHPDRKVALVPLGTANNIAQSLGILSSIDPGAGEEILTAWQHANEQFIDIGIVTGPWGEQRFVEAVGIGPLARTVIQFKSEDVDPVDSMRLGRAALAHAVKNCRPLDSRISVDGVALTGDLLMVEVMNIQHAGSRVRLAPDAIAGDGQFDVVILPAENRDEFVAWIEAGSDKEPPPARILRGSDIRIAWHGEPLRIDDHAPETAVHAGEVHVGYASQRLAVLVPSMIDKKGKPAAKAEGKDKVTESGIIPVIPCR